MDKIIRLDNISAGYEGRNAIENISLDVSAGDFIGITGPNGCGKTTLVKVMLRLLKPSAGEISYYRNGVPVSNLSTGYLPQYNAIDRKFPISVSEAVKSGMKPGKLPWARYTEEQTAQVEDTLRLVGLEGLGKRHIGALSGGQLQRALLARAIVSKPELVILDEPDTYIDTGYRTQMYDILASMSHNCAVILVTHNIGEAANKLKHIFKMGETLHK